MNDSDDRDVTKGDWVGVCELDCTFVSIAISILIDWYEANCIFLPKVEASPKRRKPKKSAEDPTQRRNRVTH
jgi:hypothetical protein